MPVVLCPHCDHRQTVSKDLAGLTARCAECGEGMQIPHAVPKSAKPPSAPTVEIAAPEMTGSDVRKTVVLLGGLILGVVLILGVLLYAVTPSKKETPTPGSTAVKTPAVPDRDPAWGKLPAERDAPNAGWTMASVMAMGYAVLVFVTVLLIGYAVGIFVAGVALAKDAAARGLSPLPWAAAYFAFHAVGPMLGWAVAAPLMVTFPPLGVMAGVILAVIGGWYGGLMYLAVRRPGRKSACPRCRNLRLSYLVLCPHCGHVEPDAG